MKILYVNDKEKFGYYKITAIKSDDFEFGSAELDDAFFSVIIMDLTPEQIAGWENENKYCINAANTGIKLTPEEYLMEAIAETPLEEVIITPPKEE